jgi:phosphomannomutase/phosphomannomutase/phosphoglucomutase
MAAVDNLNCFKAYDIRGQLGKEFNRDIAYRIGFAYAKHLNASSVAVGGDIRLSSDVLKQALARGIMDAGCDVIDIGTVGTEEVYFAAFHLDVDGAIEVTASHNLMDYNGMKLVAKGAVPISGDSGLHAIKESAESLTSPYLGEEFSVDNLPAPELNVSLEEDAKGKYSNQSVLGAYVEHLLTYISPDKIKPIKLVVNAGNGAAGHVIDAIEHEFKTLGIPVSFIKVHHQPDGTFPNGIPNPLLPENRSATAEAVVDTQADMGIAWDGDFDRCFLFDEKGRFIEGYYIVGLLAEAFLRKSPGENIIHDPRLTWNTIDQVKAAGGQPIQSKTGHAFIKERMRKENAIYGGEMSAHHYFRDFAYCDSGMIPWLLVSELLSISSKPLSELVNERMEKYPCSGEINYKVKDVDTILNRIVQFYQAHSPQIDTTDGISLEFKEWRFNLRASNTEPLLRLNVETHGDSALLNEKVEEIERLISE